MGPLAEGEPAAALIRHAGEPPDVEGGGKCEDNGPELLAAL